MSNITKGLGGKANNKDNQRLVDDEITKILYAPLNQICLPAYTELEVWETGIIAQRKYKDKGKGKKTDNLIRALPM
jgi:hypothetical protein